MNLEQTRQILSFIWSANPNAPKMDDVDKQRIAAAYCITLHEYSFHDVMDAVLECGKKSTFVPSAFEILAHCKKRYDIGRFMPCGYDDRLVEADAISERIRGAKLAASCAFISKANGKAISKDEEKALDDYMDLIQTRNALEKELKDMENKAEIAAICEYDERERLLLVREFGEDPFEKCSYDPETVAELGMIGGVK